MSKKHSIVVALAALAFVALIVGAALGLRPKPQAPSPVVMSPEEKVKFIASDKFKDLSKEQQAQFLQQSMRRGEPGEMFKADQSLTQEERDKLRRNMRSAMEERRKQEVDAYFALPAGQRDAYLDSVVKDMASRPPPGPPPQADGKRPSGPPPGGGFSHFKERVDSTDPVTRAKEMEYRKAVMNKMKQKFGGRMPMGPPPR